MKNFYVNKPLLYKIKVIKFHSAAASGLATGAFQKCNWGLIDSMVERGLIKNKVLSAAKKPLQFESARKQHTVAFISNTTMCERSSTLQITWE